MRCARRAIVGDLRYLMAKNVLDMGLHRQAPDARGPGATKERLIYWYAYMLDKCLALTFGHAPMLHDYDATIQRPMYPDDLSDFRGR